MYFIANINTKKFWNIPKEKCFASLIILNLFIKFFVHHFVDVALTFFNSSFNSFLFDVTFFTWLSKSVLFTKLAISLLLAEFACYDLAAKCYTVNLLNFGLVIYLSSLWSVIFFSISLIFVS